TRSGTGCMRLRSMYFTIRSRRSGLPRHRSPGFLTLPPDGLFPSLTAYRISAFRTISHGVSGKKSEAKFPNTDGGPGGLYIDAAHWRMVLLPLPFSPTIAIIGNPQ